MKFVKVGPRDVIIHLIDEGEKDKEETLLCHGAVILASSETEGKVEVEQRITGMFDMFTAANTVIALSQTMTFLVEEIKSSHNKAEFKQFMDIVINGLAKDRGVDL